MEDASAAAGSKTNAPVRMATEAETAEYIGDLVSQLERLARTHGLVSLQYLLAACREEARRLAGA